MPQALSAKINADLMSSFVMDANAQRRRMAYEPRSGDRHRNIAGPPCPARTNGLSPERTNPQRMIFGSKTELARRNLFSAGDAICQFTASSRDCLGVSTTRYITS